MINEGGPEVRRIHLNVTHSANPKVSPYGESVGHYEGGDTLVVDTIGLSDDTYIDNYRTPHTTQLHVIERFKVMNAGKTLDVTVRARHPWQQQRDDAGKECQGDRHGDLRLARQGTASHALTYLSGVAYRWYGAINAVAQMLGNPTTRTRAPAPSSHGRSAPHLR